MRVERMRQKGSEGKGAWQKVFRAVGEAKPRPGKVAVGVSGGADSVVLAEALWRWGARPVIWHFDHRWRGRKGAADARWVKAWARKRGLKVVLGRAKKEGRTGEGEARELRWDFFSRAAKSSGVKQLWLAHQADDQAETVLMQLLRGSGPDGLAGMSGRAKRLGLEVVRPLLGVGREEVRKAAGEAGLSWREDKTNIDQKGWRSRVRNSVLPYLAKKYGRDVRGALCRAAEILAGEKEYWEKEIGRLVGHPDVRDWRQKPVAWQRRAIRGWLERLGQRGANLFEIDGVRKLLEGGKTSSWQLRGGRVQRSGNKLFWRREMGRIAKAGNR